MLSEICRVQVDMDRYSYPYDMSAVQKQHEQLDRASAGKETTRGTAGSKVGAGGGGKEEDPAAMQKQLKKLESELKMASQIPMGAAHVDWREKRMLKQQESAKVHAKSSRRSFAPLPTKAKEYLDRRDFTGALTTLRFLHSHDSGAGQETGAWGLLPWVGYTAFHVGDFEKALEVYRELEGGSVAPPPFTLLNTACCLYHMQQYDEAKEICLRKDLADGCTEAEEEVTWQTANRILFHIAYKQDDETKILEYHDKLQEASVEDQLSLAAMHFLRGHFQEATTIYKRLVVSNREALAINIYLALCYYKLDYYDVSVELLGVYLVQYPDSGFARNLKACNAFRLYNGFTAEKEAKSLPGGSTSQADLGSDLLAHNLCVFREGEGGLKVWPPLLNFIPEARLNLTINRLKTGDYAAALELIEDAVPLDPVQYILKAVAYSCMAEHCTKPIPAKEREMYKLKAMELFNAVGASASECDTIPGRQSMASKLFLAGAFADVNVYLSSVKQYMFSDDAFNWNYGISLAATGNFKEAQEALLSVKNEEWVKEYTYLRWLLKCYIANKQAPKAWALYLDSDDTEDSLEMLVLLANECYLWGAFLISAKAFDVLLRLDSTKELYWEGKRGACIGVFQQVVAGLEPRDSLEDVVELLKRNGNDRPQVDYIVRVIAKWNTEMNLTKMKRVQPVLDSSNDSYM